jgi:hypothetical protein
MAKFLSVLILEFLSFDIVSDFDIRISDLFDGLLTVTLRNVKILSQ